MKKKISFVLLVSMLLTSSFIAGADNLKLGQKEIVKSSHNQNDADVPQWSIGDYWIYELVIDGGIPESIYLNNVVFSNLKFEVSDVQNDFYLIDLTGDVSGTVQFNLDIIELSGTLQDTELSGIAYINKSNLATDKVQDFELNGFIKPPILPKIPINMDGEIEYSFGKTVLDFPLNRDTNWYVDEVSVSLEASVNLLPDIISEIFYIETHFVECQGWDVVYPSDSEYDALKMYTTELGDEHSVWYSPAAGNVVKIEGINIPVSWGYLGEYDFEMNLVSTNFQYDSNPPTIPSKPSGPSILIVGQDEIYETSATDPDGDLMKYIFDWGDGTFSGSDFVLSGQIGQAEHQWNNMGEFEIKAKSRDKYGYESLWSQPLTVTVINNEPEIPDAPDGPAEARVRQYHTYTATSTDPDGHKIRFLFSWGDGKTTWTDYVESGEIAEAEHKWFWKGSYEIKVKAQDEFGLESEWSDSLPVTMPKFKDFNSPFNDLLAILFEILPGLINLFLGFL